VTRVTRVTLAALACLALLGCGADEGGGTGPPAGDPAWDQFYCAPSNNSHPCRKQRKEIP
jgi:hypothetical protein